MAKKWENVPEGGEGNASYLLLKRRFALKEYLETQGIVVIDMLGQSFMTLSLGSPWCCGQRRFKFRAHRHSGTQIEDEVFICEKCKKIVWGVYNG